MSGFRCLLFILCCFPCLSWSQEDDGDSTLPLWDAGAALVYLRFPYYPASDQTKTWFLPAPTFEYRGEILRSSQREGTRAYFIRSDRWSIEMGGDGVPEIKSNETFARQGMDNIPWSLQLGPKAVYRGDNNWRVNLGVYQAIITDFSRFKTNGFTYQGQIAKTWLNEIHNDTIPHALSKTTLALGAEAASQEYMGTYFDVRPEFATVERPAYESRSGFLSYEVLVGESIKFKKLSIFSYIISERFENSVNRRSPLHKSDENLTVTFGLSYVLYESDKKSIPADQAEGLLQKIKLPSSKPSADE